MREYQRQVENGIRILDSYFSDWRNKIDLSSLNLNSVTKCVLGQLYGDYFVGREALRLDLITSPEYGFSLEQPDRGGRQWKALQEEWERHLKD